MAAISGGTLGVRHDLGKLAAGDLIAAEAIVEDAELELQSRRVRRKDQHALERGNGPLLVADLGGNLGIFECDVEIAGILKHLPEQNLGPCLDVSVGPRR